jgi:zinc/manganese transport system permease protein
MVALDLLWWPFLACLVLAGVHVYLGLHVLARGVIFVDLALAQVAALGMTVALLAGYGFQSAGASYYALAFTGAGAAIFALTRPRRDAPATPRAPTAHGIPQEAIIGIVYAVAAALTVLVLDRVPQGGEQIKQLLVGSVLAVTPGEVARIALLYALIGTVHWLCRRPLLALSLGAEPRHARAWDFVFYSTFGLVVTSSVQVAGVLLVFSFLIVPAVIGAWLASSVAGRLAVGWGVAFAVSVVGLTGSYLWDLPTGAAVVASFGGALLVVAGLTGLVGLVAAVRQRGAEALAPVASGAGAIVAVCGALLVGFPHADHYWLDALERLVPAVQTLFLTPGEREVRAESAAAVARAAAELARLRAQQADVQWGARDEPPEQRERLRQFTLGRGEMVAGDRAVLAALRQRARERQRYALGLPLVAAGVSLGVVASRSRRPPAAR